jgi:hypothetical protein
MHGPYNIKFKKYLHAFVRRRSRLRIRNVTEIDTDSYIMLQQYENARTGVDMQKAVSRWQDRS